MPDVWEMTVKDGLKGKGDSMHSHDRTMIAKLGFADDDKRNPEHDLACRYLMEDEIASRITAVVVSPIFETRLKMRLGDLQRCRRPDADKSDPPSYRDLQTEQLHVEACGSAIEVPLMKGDGKYATTLGFLDVQIEFYASNVIRAEHHETYYEYDTEDGKWRPGATTSKRIKWKPFRELFDAEGKITIEVKINEIGIGEAIRQIKFYRSFIHLDPREICPFVLATRYEVSEQEASTLRGEGIYHIHLGEGFTKWTENLRNEAAPSKTSIRL